MPAGVAVLGAERRPERVDLRQRAAVRLDVQLTADREERLAAEEVLREVGAAFGRARNRVAVGEVERADAEHLAGAFRIARRDDRRVHPEEAALVEVAVHRHAERMPHARDRAEGVGARPQVRDLAQVLERGLLRLNRIRLRVVHPADDLDRFGLQLDRLALALARRHRPGRDDRAARRQLLDLALVVGQRGRGDDLERDRSTTRRERG